MDRARRIGGLLWVGAGSAAELVWLLAFGGHVGWVTAGLLASCAVVAVLVSWPSSSSSAWWAGRLVGALVGLDLWGAVADRFGLLGAPGQPGVSWGTWSAFVAYTGELVPRLGSPTAWAVVATMTEASLGTLLLVGSQWRWVGKATAGLLLVYLVVMATTVGWAEILRYAVPVLVGAALLSSARGARPRHPAARATSRVDARHAGTGPGDDARRPARRSGAPRHLQSSHGQAIAGRGRQDAAGRPPRHGDSDPVG